MASARSVGRCSRRFRVAQHLTEGTAPPVTSRMMPAFDAVFHHLDDVLAGSSCRPLDRLARQETDGDRDDRRAEEQED